MDSGHSGRFMAQRTKRLWTDEEKRSIRRRRLPPVSTMRRAHVDSEKMFFCFGDALDVTDAKKLAVEVLQGGQLIR